MSKDHRVAHYVSVVTTLGYASHTLDGGERLRIRKSLRLGQKSSSCCSAAVGDAFS